MLPSTLIPNPTVHTHGLKISAIISYSILKLDIAISGIYDYQDNDDEVFLRQLILQISISH